MELGLLDNTDKKTLQNHRGIRYLDFKKSLQPKYHIAWLEIALGYIGLIGLVGLSLFLQKNYFWGFWLWIPLIGFFIGYIIAALNLFMHEASHYFLSPDKKSNEVLSNIFIGLLIGMEVNFYRSIHFAHHRLIGTKNDTEKSYLDGLSLRFLAEALTGIRLLKVLMNRNKDIKSTYGQTIGKEIIQKNNRLFLLATIVHASLVLTLFYFGNWQAAASWVLGMVIFFPFFAMFRQILEHRIIGSDPNLDYSQIDHGAAHRIFGDGPIASTLGAAGFNRHLIHHWDADIAYTNLKEVEEFLLDTHLKEELLNSRITYWETFWSLFQF